MAFHDVFNNGAEFGLFVLVNQISVIVATGRLICGNWHHTKFVDLVEFVGFSHGGTSHTGQFVVKTEVVLQRDGGQSLVFVLDGDALFGLNGLVHAFVVTTARQNAARVLINDENFAVHHDIVLVALEKFLRADGVVEITNEGCVDRLVEVVDLQYFFNLRNTGLKHSDSSLLLIDFVVLFTVEASNKASKLLVPVCCLVRWSTDDQWRSSLVDQNRVGFVDDCEVVAALHTFFERPRHVVAKVIKTKFVVSAVRDVAVVCLTTLCWSHRCQDHSDVEA